MQKIRQTGKFQNKKGASFDAPFFFHLAAAAAIVVTAAGTQQTATATIAQQDEDQNDPANVAATETVIIAHSPYLRIFLRLIYRSFQDIPQQ